MGTESRCTGCDRQSYVSGRGVRINPLVDGLCPDCREGWACHGCGKRHAFDELSETLECGRCFIARMGMEAT